MGTLQARAQRTPECQEVASKLPARHHVTHSADARSWARNKCTENQKNKKKSVYHIDTTADACQSTSRSGFLKSIATKKNRRTEKTERTKIEYKGRHTYSHGPCVDWTALRTKVLRPALSFMQHKQLYIQLYHGMCKLRVFRLPRAACVFCTTDYHHLRTYVRYHPSIIIMQRT